jgi:dTDP-glucose 4,6-dehydratase
MSRDFSKKKNYLVTGGAGFIGSEFVRQRFAKEDFGRIYIIDKLTYASDMNRIKEAVADSRIEFIESDICDTENYSKVLNDIDEIVHFAAESHVDRSITNGFPFVMSNVVGSYSLLETARMANVERVIMISTDEVYGSIENGETDEMSGIKPSSTYSASKAASDLLALAQAVTFNQNIVITRASNNYGDYQNVEKFIPNIIFRALNNLRIPIYGNGKNVREWLHIEDHIGAIDKISQSGVAGQIYNIGSGERYSNLEVAKLILSKLGKSNELLEFVEDRKGHDFRYALDSSRMLREFDWKPNIKFEAGISKLVSKALSES